MKKSCNFITQIRPTLQRIAWAAKIWATMLPSLEAWEQLQNIVEDEFILIRVFIKYGLEVKIGY